MSTLFSYFLMGGWVMWPILVLSLLAAGIAIERGAAILRESRREDIIAARVHSGLGHHLCVAEWERKAAQAGSRELRRLESNLGWLPIIANTATLLGLFGTVLGMCEVFRSIETAGGPADPRMLAGGIWTALITTVGGLAVAIPTTLVYHFLLRRVDGLAARLSESMEEMRDAVMISGSGAGVGAGNVRS
jgi:biopolymer transport protein ExbB